MSDRTKVAARGFTLIELMVVLSGLIVFGVGLDLVDLVDRPTFLKGKGIAGDTKSLLAVLHEAPKEDFEPDVKALADPDKRAKAIERLKTARYRALPALEKAAKSDNKAVSDAAKKLLPFARRANREHRFLVQVACRELGQRRAEKARPTLEHLAKDPDYFISKHARKAIAMIDHGPPKDVPKHVVPPEIQKLLPSKAQVIATVPLPGDLRQEVRSMLENTTPQARNSVVNQVVATIGNLELSKLQVLSHDDKKSRMLLVLAKGHFDQDAIVKVVSERAESVKATDQTWVGRSPNATVAMLDGQYIAMSITVQGGPLDAETILKVVRAFKATTVVD